jgi:hypothetical protein
MKPKKLPRLWCALQGLLPLEACLAAQQAELAWPESLKTAATEGEAPRPRRTTPGAASSGAVKPRRR